MSIVEDVDSQNFETIKEALVGEDFAEAMRESRKPPKKINSLHKIRELNSLYEAMGMCLSVWDMMSIYYYQVSVDKGLKEREALDFINLKLKEMYLTGRKMFGDGDD